MLIYGKELVFDEVGHLYRWDGQPVPGVTTILQAINKPALVSWAANMAADHFANYMRLIKSTNGEITDTHIEIAQKEAKSAHRTLARTAADSGTNVHAYAEAHFKKQPYPELRTDSAKRGVEAFHKWLDQHTIKILASERRIFSKDLYFAGTCDFVAMIDGEMTVGDIKTSSGIWPEMLLQTAAYTAAIIEEKNIPTPKRLIVRFDKKTANFQAHPLPYFYERDRDAFINVLHLHRALQQIQDELKSH